MVIQKEGLKIVRYSKINSTRCCAPANILCEQQDHKTRSIFKSSPGIFKLLPEVIVNSNVCNGFRIQPDNSQKLSLFPAPIPLGEASDDISDICARENVAARSKEILQEVFA